MEVYRMKVKFHPILWGIVVITSILILGYIFFVIGAFSEKVPSHSLDFQKVSVIQLKQEVESVEDGLKHALAEAQLWREDVVLTGINIYSSGEDEIRTQTGKITYEFQFPFQGKESPSGAIFVTIDTNSNNIELVTASHDGEEYERNLSDKRLDLKDDEILEYYNIILEEFKNEEIFEHKYQSFQFELEQNRVYCTIKLSDDGKNYERKVFETIRE
jgi:hypothetical protein